MIHSHWLSSTTAHTHTPWFNPIMTQFSTIQKIIYFQSALILHLLLLSLWMPTPPHSVAIVEFSLNSTVSIKLFLILVGTRNQLFFNFLLYFVSISFTASRNHVKVTHVISSPIPSKDGLAGIRESPSTEILTLVYFFLKFSFLLWHLVSVLQITE